jgi:hypothetical protein
MELIKFFALGTSNIRHLVRNRLTPKIFCLRFPAELALLLGEVNAMGLWVARAFFTVLCFGSTILWALDVPIAVEVENFGGFKSIVEGLLQVDSVERPPFVVGARLLLRNGDLVIPVDPQDVELLVTERFIQSTYDGFLLPGESGEIKRFVPSRRDQERARLYGWLGPDGKLRQVGLFLKASVNKAEPGHVQEIFWPLDQLQRQQQWQKSWAFGDNRWDAFPTLMHRGNVRMDEYPLALQRLAKLIGSPTSSDDQFFAYEAANLLGIHAADIQSVLAIQHTPKPADWVQGLKALEAKFVEEKRRAHSVQPPAYLGTPLGKTLLGMSQALRLLHLLQIYEKGGGALGDRNLKALTEYFMGGASGVQLLLQQPGPFSDADYSKALWIAYERARIRQARQHIQSELTLKTPRDKLRILMAELAGGPSAGHDQYHLAAAISVAADLLGGEAQVRVLCQKPSGELGVAEYQRALKTAYRVAPSKEPATLTTEALRLLQDWPINALPVQVSVNGQRVLGKLFVRGPDSNPLGMKGFYRDQMALVYEADLGRGRQQIQHTLERNKIVPLLWVHAMGDDRRVVWRVDGQVVDAHFEALVFQVGGAQNVSPLFLLKLSSGTTATYYHVDPTATFPRSCGPELLRYYREGSASR